MYLFHCWWYDVTKVTKLQTVEYVHCFGTFFFLKITLLGLLCVYSRFQDLFSCIDLI